MNGAPPAGVRLRRARPLLGTLVEVGIAGPRPQDDQGLQAAVEAAFAAVLEVQQALSRFEPDSDVSRFHALAAGQALHLRPASQAVLAAAAELQAASGGDFDISLGTAPAGWRLAGELLHKLDAATRLDLGGIAKGHAVDRAVEALQAHGCAAGWVNAGGDLRSFGAIALPLQLRDEHTGGVRHFATLQDGAFATSHFSPRSRAGLPQRRGTRGAPAHVSVAAPQGLWADALTKIVAWRGDPADPLLRRYQASAWLH